MRRLTPVALLAFVFVGCTSRLVTNTPRSAIEQLLLSGAVDRALAKLELPEVRGKKTFVDLSNLKAYDVEYIRVATRARIGQMGAILVGKVDDAEVVVEVASGGVGTEFKDAVVGLPTFPIPNSPVSTPELNAYKTHEQTGIVKLLVFVHERGRLLTAMHCYAKCDRDESFSLWYRFHQEDNIRQGWEKADRDARTREAATRPK